MSRLGLCGGTLRLPLTELAETNQPVVEAALRACVLLKG
jgi:4-hydroxy-tetrahydrodipicolinate synthase